MPLVAPRGSCGFAVYHPTLPAPNSETHITGPYLHPPDVLSLEFLAIVHAIQSFPSLRDYTGYSGSSAAIRDIQNRTLALHVQQEKDERAPSALQRSTVFLCWVPGRSGIDGGCDGSSRALTEILVLLEMRRCYRNSKIIITIQTLYKH